MSSPDPEDSTRRDESGSGSAGARRFELPDDVDAAFADIVADWASTGAPRWPEAPDDLDGPSSGLGVATPPQGQPAAHPERPVDDLFSSPPADPAPEPPRPAPPMTPAAQQPHRPHPPARPEDEHFVPPEPPPLPRIGMSSLFGLLLLVVGVVLLALPGLVGGIAGLGIVPGLLAMAAGLGWLVVGMRRPSGSDDPEGTV
ncbi:hypothetical protein [Actinomycetospora termitidis]|uniref:Uncharacterized protein n=1 Tax=Actinomycetospora termitidis TaxID=3053470 RepID=A0ABT7M867_9PSEU|nr:hypothetical protein [Actinomycetospora sp. Odt1-22]MDL5156855.1 hypothetical protein [Actinomycetospora sp. Odt1-22]